MIEDGDITRRDIISRRYTVLSECLTLVEAMKRRASKNEASREPKPGYEAVFDEEDKRLQVLREMMQELRDEESVLLMRMYGLDRKGKSDA